MALVVVDMPIRVDGLNLAFLGAQLAGVAALLAALEPVEQAHPAGHRQRRTERAHVAAEHLAGENVDHQQDHRVEHEPPLAVELEHDGGLERLHLGGLLGQHHRFREMPNSTSRMMYLIAHSRSCTAKGSSYWGILNLRATSLISSCSA